MNISLSNLKVYLQKFMIIISKLPFGASEFCEAFLFLLRDNSDTSGVWQDSSALYLPMVGESFVLIFHLKRL